MELEELRQRLLLRSKSADIPPIAHPVQIPEVALSQAAGKLKWETTLSPEVAARLGKNGAGAKGEASAAKPENGSASRAEDAPAVVQSADKEPTSQRPSESASSEETSPVAEPVAAQTETISILANTVDQLSEPAEVFREHFEHLGKQLEPIDAATQSAQQALGRITGLFEHLSSLANNFQSVKAFAEQVKTLSASFEPMKALNAQLDLVMEALYANVKEVGAALAPVKIFQDRVRKLATALDSIDKLEGQISELAEAFRPASEKPAPPQGMTQPEKPAQVAQAA